VERSSSGEIHSRDWTGEYRAMAKGGAAQHPDGNFE